MKKTLIALAAVAATSAAFAQSSVNLTGEFAYGFQQTTTAGVKSKGFGMDTAAVKVSVTEDLGGGLKAIAAMQLANIARGNTVGGEDFTMVLAGGFGSILLGQIEIGSGIRGLGQAGAPVNNMEGEILGAAVNGDIVKYATPSFGGFKASVSFVEGTGAPVLGLGNGMNAGQSRSVTLGGEYASGPIAAKIDTTSWSQSATADSRYRLSGSYDLGVVKLGAGYEDLKTVASTHVKQSILGVSAPLGPVTVGAVYVTNKTAAGTRKGYSLGASYALSKRTSVIANYAAWEPTVAAAKDKKTWIVLDHTF
jgi:predicted porin